MKETIAVACDHAGYIYKEKIIKILKDKNFDVKDFGTNSEESCDYPDFIHPMAKSINNETFKRGIIICGSGNGVSMVANKYPKVRAAICWNIELAELARLHNDANILSLSARFVEFDLAAKIIDIFLDTDFEGGRHQRRVDKI